MSAFHPIATEQQTQFYVASMPKRDIALIHFPTGSPLWHAVEFRDRVEIVDPRLLRPNKRLLARH
jgi:hypothetical protein